MKVSLPLPVTNKPGKSAWLNLDTDTGQVEVALPLMFAQAQFDLDDLVTQVAALAAAQNDHPRVVT